VAGAVDLLLLFLAALLASLPLLFHAALVRLALDLLPLVLFAFLLLTLLLQLAVEGLAFLPICSDAKSIRHLCSIAALCICKRMGFRNSPWPVVL
jgi:hypothetical protein